MPIQDTNATNLYLKAETAWGEAPASGTMQQVPFTGETMKYDKLTEESDIIRADRMVDDLAWVGEGVSGSVNFELARVDPAATGWMALVLKAAMQGAFFTAAASGNWAATATGNKFTKTAHGITVFPGQHIYVDGFTNAANNGYHRVTAVGTNDITVATTLVTETAGAVKFGDIIDGVTMQEQLDEVTGLSRKVIIESKDKETRPRLSVKDEGGVTLKIPGTENDARYFLPIGANIAVNEGDEVEAGDVIARIPRETTKDKDITGGLPRVAELFEARKPKDFAVITEIDGVVQFGKDVKGKRKVVVVPDIGEPAEYLVPKGRHLTVQEQDRVRAGDALMDGSANPHDILKVLGEKQLGRYLVDEIQEVYRLQGVRINDKHIETIVRQMLRRVRVKDIGDTRFLIDEQVEKSVFEIENERVMMGGGRPATAEPMLLGITKASLSTPSFISASSFQETTKVLTEAALAGRIDHLRGLKENVIMGRLIPAGTGLAAYNKLVAVVDPELLEEDEEYEMTLDDREGPLLASLPGIAVNE